MKYVYLIAAVAGALVPYAFFFDFFQEHGFGLVVFSTALFVNGATSGFTSDLLISSFVFWAFMFQHKTHANGPSPIPFITLNLCIGLSCALPAYLYASHRSLQSS